MFDKQLFNFPDSKKALAVCCAFAFLRAFAILGQAICLSLAVCGLWEGFSLSESALSLALFAICFIFRELMVFLEESYIDSFAERSVRNLQKSFIEGLYEGGPLPLKEQGTPSTVALLVDGSDDIAQYLRVAIPKITDCAIIPIVILVSLFFLDIVSAIIALVCLPFMMILMRLIGMSAKDEASKRHAQFERLSNSFVNKALGIVDLKSFGADSRFAKLIYKTSESFRLITMKTLRVAMLSSAVLDLFSTLALAAVAIMLGFRMVEGDVAFLPALCVLVLVPEYFKPVREFGSNYHDTLSGKESLKSILSRIDLFKNQDNWKAPFWADSLTNSKSLAIDTRRTTSTAITGSSGNGKTTLLNALAGLTDPPADFEFIIDGQNHSTLRDDSWRRRVAYIPQDPHIFSDTVRENVRFYNPYATDDEIVVALELVGLGDLLQSLPDGIDTYIGEGGHGLSGGQLARIALARSFVDKSRDVLMMDEPSAHLDSETEDVLEDALSSLSGEKTVIVVTHSENLANNLDRELVVSDTSGSSSNSSGGN